MSTVLELGEKAKKCCSQINTASTATKNKALFNISQKLKQSIDYIIQQNKRDIKTAKQMNIPETMLDRLMLNENRINDMADAVLKLIELDDPVGLIERGVIRPNGLRINKTRVPLGTIGIIFESRPNVSVDAATLCLKAGNAVILRGGKEAINSNKALVEIMRQAIKESGFCEDIISLVEDLSRDSATELMKLNGYIDVLIPRGGAGLINAVVQNATVPVIETGTGNCHIYVDKYAKLPMALDIAHNAKVSRPSVCNAAESLLVHKDIAQDFLPDMKKMFDKSKVTIVGCEKTRAILKNQIDIATEQDYATEYLDYKISVKVVDTLDQAIEHIAEYSTHHSEAIITDDIVSSQKFIDTVDAAAVYVNASTRFTDGAEFGMGAEIGISTQKLHARGPMGLNELTSIKYVVMGNGQIK